MTEGESLLESVVIRESGDAEAREGGVANSGSMRDVNIEHHHHHGVRVVEWPVVVGSPPPLASAFQPREGVRNRVRAARDRGENVVLAQEGGARVLSGGGGVGKSQLAAWFVRDALAAGVDLVVWVNADTARQVVAAYAKTAVRVGVPGVLGEDSVVDAAALVEWLHTTERTWLVVLDDITDPAHLTNWWPPHTRNGWTLATTRLRDAALTGSGRRRVDVDTYTPDESTNYLRERLTDADVPHLLDDHVPMLADVLGHLPLALSHAAAYMIDQEIGSGAYLSLFSAGDQRLDDLMPPGSDPDAYGRPVAVALLLALRDVS
ncbi:NB-ARC domain-containing protein [Actinokineospora sp. 24-640]